LEYRRRYNAGEFTPVPYAIFVNEIATLTKVIATLKQRVRQLEKKINGV
jgi:ubiquinone biosynthesis protein UbiJ